MCSIRQKTITDGCPAKSCPTFGRWTLNGRRKRLERKTLDDFWLRASPVKYSKRLANLTPAPGVPAGHAESAYPVCARGVGHGLLRTDPSARCTPAPAPPPHTGRRGLRRRFYRGCTTPGPPAVPASAARCVLWRFHGFSSPFRHCLWLPSPAHS